MKIEKEIVQAKFKSSFHRGVVNVIFTSNWLSTRQMKVLKPFGVTTQQFNILRILRGQHPNPASITLLTERMLDKMSNASRLVDKLISKGLVERSICSEDRRQANVVINEAGLDILKKMDSEMDVLYKSLQRLTEDEMDVLSDLLDRLRE